MSTQEHYCKANAHDLRFWSRVQDELIQFCHDWCTNEKRELYDVAIDLDRIVEAGLLVTAFAVSAEEITIFYPADDCGKMVIRNYAPLSPIASTGQFCIAA